MPCLLTRSSTESWEPRGTPLVGCEHPRGQTCACVNAPLALTQVQVVGERFCSTQLLKGPGGPGFAMFSTRLSCVPASADRERRQTETDLGHLCGQGWRWCAHSLTHHWPVLIPKDVLNCKGSWKVKHSCVSRKEVKRIW